MASALGDIEPVRRVSPYSVIDAGSLKYAAQVQTLDDSTADQYGEQSESWSTSPIRHRVSVEPLSGEELEVAKQMQPEVTHVVTMHSIVLSPKQRLAIDTGRRKFTLAILSVLNIDEWGRVIRIQAKEIPGG